MTAAATTTAATMTDPLLPNPEISASAAERLAALRQPSTSKKRQKPAHTSKVLTAGLSTTALLGMVAVMGWQSGTGTAQTSTSPTLAVPTEQTAAPTPVTPTVAPLVPTPTTVSGVIAVPPAPAPAATIPVPATLPVIQVPVVQVPVAVPAAQPPARTTAGRAQSNTTTKSSG